LQRAAGGGKIKLLNAGPALDSDVLWFNQNTNRNAVSGEPLVNPAKLQWFRNQKFRQAVSLSIDRDRIARTVYAGRAEASQGFCSAALKKWNHPGIARATFDPVRARRLFAEIGLADRNGDSLLEDADGNAVEILFNTNLGNPTRLATARRVVEDLRQAGLRVDLQTILFPELGQRVSNSTDYDMVLLGLGGGGADPAASVPALRSDSPACPWFPAQPAPSTDWEARLDTLLDEQMRTLDFAQRKKAFDEVQSILAEQLPLIDLVAPAAYTAVRPGIGNVRPSALTPYRATWNLEEWYWK
jgi:peptide/nickel transport system substrate-binding protein